MSRRCFSGRAVVVVVAAGALAWFAAPVLAQEGQSVPPPPPDRTQIQPGDSGRLQQPTDRQQQPTRQTRQERKEYRAAQRNEQREMNEGDNAINFVRASKLMDAKVVNPSGTHLGSVENLAINAEQGQVAYVVVASGGFLGMGDKKFAIPWTALNIRTGDRVVLDADKQTLKDMNGFRGKDWPATADARWLQHGRAAGGEYAEAGAEERGSVAYDFKGSDLVGKKVRNDRGDTLGTLHDLVIDPRDGHIIYGVILRGAKLHMGGDLVAVPWPAFDTREKDNLRLNIDKQRFDTAPTFTRNDWSVLSDQDFMHRTYAFYDIRPGQEGMIRPGQEGMQNRELNAPGVQPQRLPAERREVPPQREPVER